MSNAREPVASGFVRGQTGWRRVVRSAVVWLVAVLACCPSATYSSDYSGLQPLGGDHEGRDLLHGESFALSPRFGCRGRRAALTAWPTTVHEGHASME
jgi:hypothetical protein